MKTQLFKLFLLTFLIPIFKTQDIQKELNENEEPNISDDDDSKLSPGAQTKTNNPHIIEYSKSLHKESKIEQQQLHKKHQSENGKLSYLGDQKKSQHHKNHLEKDETAKPKSLNTNVDNTNLNKHKLTENNKNNSNISLDKHKITEYNKNDSNQSLGDHKTFEIYDKDSTQRQDEQNTSENETQDSSLDKPKTTNYHMSGDKRPGHNESTIVTENEFAYMVAVLKGAVYICAGALIDENWVLTAADSLHLMRDSMRLLRIRLGSINYKKGGTLLPIKYLEIHPYYDSSKPSYNLALIMLPKPVRYTPSIRSVRLQLTPKEITASHCIVTSWTEALKPLTNLSRLEIIKRHIMVVNHLHPADPDECIEDLEDIGAEHEGVMCLETGKDACVRDVGAPVVINGVLQGIISSWKPTNCGEDDPTLIFATIVSAKNISNWIHAAVHGHRWQSTESNRNISFIQN